MTNTELAKKIKGYMKERGVKESAVAEYMKLSKQSLSYAMRGQRKITVCEYVDICGFLHVPFDFFLNDTKEGNYGKL